MKDLNYVIAFDFGTKNIGMAVGQKLTCTAQPLTTIKNFSGNPDWYSITRILNEWEPKVIVVGYPLDMYDNKQLITMQTQRFVTLLRSMFNIHIFLQDERLTTVEARSILFNLGGYRKLKKSCVNSKSAALILEDWLVNSFIYKNITL